MGVKHSQLILNFGKPQLDEPLEIKAQFKNDKSKTDLYHLILTADVEFENIPCVEGLIKEFIS
jgi:hypothetical protein